MRVTMGLCLAYVLAASAIYGQEPAQQDVVIDFEGNKAFSGQQLLDTANVCLAKSPRSQRYSSDTLDYCLSRVRLFLASQGYLRAIVGPPKTQESVEGVRITVPVDEGARYRLGEITIEGSKLLSPKQLLEMLDLKSGDVAGNEVILGWLDGKVGRAYADSGHIQYTYDVDPQFRLTPEGDNIVDFKIDIDEGRLFTIRKIEFVGNKRNPDQSLHRVLLIKEGDPFNQSLYDDSIRNLNQLGLFEEIDAARDLTMKSTKGSGQLDIIVHLKERVLL